MNRIPDSAFRVVLCCLLVMTSVAPSVAAGEVASADTEENTAIGSGLVWAQNETNNTTVRHRNPEKVNEGGSTEAIREYLLRKLANRLGKSSTEISQGQYNRARSILGGEYNETLAKLVEVTGDTGTSGTTEQLARAREEQREYAAAIREYRQTQKAYREAKQAGNETRAQRLARKLERLSQNITSRSSNLTQTYRTIENQTGASLNQSTSAANQTTGNITEQQAQIRKVEFIRTSLSVLTPQRTASFDDPLTLRGQLMAANGSTLANQSVTLLIAGHPVTVKTNETGNFTHQYRPRTISLGSQSVLVEYRPDDASVYLSSNATVNVSISQTNASVRLFNYSTDAKFGQMVHVEGKVSVEGVPVSEVPIRVQLGGTKLGTVRTDENGTFLVTSNLSVSVKPGSQNLTVQLAQQERAITAQDVNRTLSVSETATNLSLQVQRFADGAILSGRLTTKDGDPIANRSVEIRQNQTVIGVVQTNESGWYNMTISEVSPPTSFRAEFSGQSVNLGSARESRSLDVGGQHSFGTDSTTIATGSLVVGVVLIGGVIVWHRRQFESTSPSIANTGADTKDTIAEVSETGNNQVELLLSEGNARLASGDRDTAVRLAYGAARLALSKRFDIQDEGTHWEFYQTCLDETSVDHDDLESLSETYEQAAYSQASVSADAASTAVDHAMRLCELP